MTALLRIDATVPAFPLGQPLDGRPRYGMTPEQACLYRWLVKYRPCDGFFSIRLRDVSYCNRISLGNAQQRVSALVERGWLEQVGQKFRFVQPVRHFKERKHG